MKIGILGGTFDPIHKGHLSLAQAARAQYQLDRVLFIPAYVSPFKQHQIPSASAEMRYQMTEAALRHHPEFILSDLEIKSPKVSYTVDTLRSLKTQMPESEFFLIMGADTAAGFSGWKEPEKIRAMAKVLVARRPGSPVTLPDPGMAWIEMPACHASSSAIRKAAALGKKDWEEDVPAEAAELIRARKVYF